LLAIEEEESPKQVSAATLAWTMTSYGGHARRHIEVDHWAPSVGHRGVFQVVLLSLGSNVLD